VKFHGTGRCTKVRAIVTQGQAEAEKTHHAKASSKFVKTIPVFFNGFFSDLKEKWFQDAEKKKEQCETKLNDIPLCCFQ
jgi:hypothetical protein